MQGDLDGQGDCSVPQTLAPAGQAGDSYTCSFTVDVLGNVGEEKTDFVIAIVEDDDGNSVFGYDTETVTFTDVPPDFTVSKTPNPASVPEDGGSVRYTVVIENLAPEDVQITSLVDLQDGVTLDLDGEGSCLVTQTIPPNGTYTCSFRRAVNGNAGDIVSDTVTATGEDDDGNTADRSADAEVLITPTDPRLTVTKVAAPSAVPEPGGDVTYTVTITNDSVSTDPVTIQSLTDSIEGGPAATPSDLDCAGASGPVTPEFVMQPGDVVTCTFAGTITGNAGDSTSDSFAVTGVDDEGAPANGSGSETVPVTDVLPTMTVTKTADPNPIPEPGGPVTYTVSVENTSPESVFISAIFDDVAGPLTPGSCVLPAGGELSAGDTYECSWIGSVSGDVGDVRSNIVTVTASDDEGNVIQVADREDTVISDVLPTFDLLKTATPTSLPEPGGNVTFTIWLTNTTIEPITVDDAVDDVYGPLSGLGTCDTLVGITIVPGDTYLCTFVAPVTGTAALSPYTDTITVSVSDNDGNSVGGDASADVELTNVTPTIRLRKGRTPASLPEPGGVFTFTIRVDNQSAIEDVILTSLDDDIYGDIAVPSNPNIVSTTCALPQTIPPGGRYDCRFDAEFLGDAGESQRDVVTATAQDDEGTEVTDTDPATVRITDVPPQISATKSPDPASLPEPGGDATFSVEIFNESTVESVELTTLDDDIYGDLTSTAGDIVSTTCVLPQTIAIGSSYACAFVAPVIGTAESSPYTDTITATAVDNEDNSAQAQASAQVELTDVLPQISLEKTASPLTLPEPGGAFTYTVVVTNDSVEPVTVASFLDIPYGDITQVQGDVTATTCATGATIPVGGTYQCDFTATFNGNAGETQSDIVFATATDDEGNVAAADDDAQVELTDVLPQISLEKTASPLTLPEPGGAFTYTVVVTNDSVEPVTVASFLDIPYGDITQVQGDVTATTCATGATIPVGGTYQCDFTATFNGNAGETQSDIVFATATDDEGNVAAADDDAQVELTDVLPQISLEKTASPLTLPEPGGAFTYTVVVTNDSVEPVTVASFLDIPYGDITQVQGDVTATTCATGATIPVGGTYQCDFTATFNGNAGETQSDIVFATATDDEGNVAAADDDAQVELTDVPSSIEVTKDAFPTEVNEPGDTVTFSITVENTSPVDTVTIDSLTDDIHGDLDGQGDCAVPFDLAPAATYACSFTADVTGNAGDTETDTVTASGTDDDECPSRMTTMPPSPSSTYCPGSPSTRRPRR